MTTQDHPGRELADAARRHDEAQQRVDDIARAALDAWDSALDEIDGQLRELATSAGAGLAEASRYNELTITVARRVSIHLLRPWHDRAHGLRITTPHGLDVHFDGNGTPPPADAVTALVRALLEHVYHVRPPVRDPAADQ